MVAVSGGADSVALLHVLSALKKRWGFELEVAYVHHGERAGSSSEAAKTNRYRAKAEKKVGAIATALELPFVALRAGAEQAQIRAESLSKKKVRREITESLQLPELEKPQFSAAHESEEALRELRLESLRNYARQTGAVAIALGHHHDDLFETRLIRLIRGTGPQGLRAMSVVVPVEGELFMWRPLLAYSRAEIEAYLLEKGLDKNRDWIDDPSNRDARYLRNDLRRRLIPLIDRVRPGGVNAMARSLQQIVDQLEDSAKDQLEQPSAAGRRPTATHGHEVQFLNRADLLALSPTRRESHFAKWLRGLGIRDISQSQIQEILKRIDTRQKRLSFEVGGRVWMIDTEIRIGSTSR